MSGPPVHVASFAELTTDQLLALLRLRVDVFVVEQGCAYPEIDGLDDAPGTRHLWVDLGGQVAASVRVLEGDGHAVIGRVVTAPAHRGRGYAAQLVRAALAHIGDRPTRIGAQVPLEGWYAQFGFARSGPDYVEDGIPHLPMVRSV